MSGAEAILIGTLIPRAWGLRLTQELQRAFPFATHST